MTDEPTAMAPEDLEEIARVATREALVDYEDKFPKETEHLTIGQFEDGDAMVFELYIAGETSEDAQVITQTFVNKFTGDVRVDV
ncbi:MAG: hypothetical protein CMK07_10965, partial [Ponticaulis sp.]|nr:hypothetical protein [Ponticaulis sp.]